MSDHLNGKKLLILGANPETAVLVRTAQGMGVYTIVTDYDPDAYAKTIADKTYNVNGIDVQRLVELARVEQVDGILVGVADPLVAPYQQVCEILGLPCYATKEQVRVFTNKYHFKRKCEEYGIHGVPEFPVRENMTDAELEYIPYPVIIKPVDSCAGKGISLCRERSEMSDAIRKALSVSPSRTIIAERYMTCDDVSIYYTFKDGKIYLSSIDDRYTCKEQGERSPVCVGDVFPSKLEQIFLGDAHKRFCKMFKDLRMDNCILYISAFYDNGEFYVYDPGFRLQGGGFHLIVNAVNGFDHRKMLINLALTGSMGDDDLDLMNDPHMNGKSAAVVWFLLKSGTVSRIEGVEYARSHPDVVHIVQRFHGGETISDDMTGTERQVFARLYIVSKDREQLKKTIKDLKNAIKVRDTDGNDMLLNGFDVQKVFGHQ